MDFSSILSSTLINKSCESESPGLLMNSDQIDLSLICYLNKELVDMGLDSITQNNHLNSNIKATDLNLLFKNSIEIVKRFSRQQNTLDRLQEQCLKLDRENELFLKRHQSLKESSDVVHRELADVEEKWRQTEARNATMIKQNKDLNEENRKLQNVVEQRDKQFKHERKKQEKEIEKLKERVQQLSTGKVKDLPNIDMNESIVRKSLGSTRATWNTDNTVSKKQIELYSELIKDYDRKNKELIQEMSELKTFLAHVHSRFSSELDASMNMEDIDLNKAIQELPFDNVHLDIAHNFGAKLNKLSKIVKSTKTLDQNHPELNSTFTINDQPSSSEDSSSHLKQSKSKNSLLSSSASSIESENQQTGINKNGSQEKRELLEQKLKLDKTWKDLNKMKKAFEEEQESFYQSKVYSSFFDSSSIASSKTNTKTRSINPSATNKLIK